MKKQIRLMDEVVLSLKHKQKHKLCHQNSKHAQRERVWCKTYAANVIQFVNFFPSRSVGNHAFYYAQQTEITKLLTR